MENYSLLIEILSKKNKIEGNAYFIWFFYDRKNDVCTLTYQEIGLKLTKLRELKKSWISNLETRQRGRIIEGAAWGAKAVSIILYNKWKFEKLQTLGDQAMHASPK